MLSNLVFRFLGIKRTIKNQYKGKVLSINDVSPPGVTIVTQPLYF